MERQGDYVDTILGMMECMRGFVWGWGGTPHALVSVLAGLKRNQVHIGGPLEGLMKTIQSAKVLFYTMPVGIACMGETFLHSCLALQTRKQAADGKERLFIVTGQTQGLYNGTNYMGG